MLNPEHLTTGTQSPFLPGTKIQFAWDSTSLGLIKTCPRLYQYTMIDGWSTTNENIHLRFGIEYHTALQDFEIAKASGLSHEDSLRATISNLVQRTHDWAVDTESRVGKYKNNETIISLVVDYLDYYRDDPAETYIKADGTPAVELSFRFELDWGPEANGHQHGSSIDGEGADGHPYLLCGHLDRVVNLSDALFVMDHKTTTTTPGSYYFNQYEPNNQMTLYTIAGQVVLNAPIKGVVISAAQILLEKPNAFIRGFTFRSPDQIQEWLDDLRFHLESAEHYATLDYWPMNDTACDKFGGCKFRGVCSQSPQVRDMFLKSDFIKLEEDKKWNPLRSR